MLKSLEISKKEIKHWIEMIDNFNSYAEEYHLCDPEEINYYIMHLNNWKKIKQDLEKYNTALELIKDLFNNIDTIDIFGTHVFICKMNNRSMKIDRPTQIKLQELKKLVGDTNE